MQQTRTRAGLIVASCLSMLVLSAAPVWANGSPHASADDVSTSTSSSSNTDVQVNNDSSDNSQGGIRSEAAKMLQMKRQEIKQDKTAAVKQKACEAHKNEIDNRAKNYSAAAQRHLDVFNGIFTKLQNFYTKKGLNVSNYDTLVADATAKQTAATNAVQALKDADVTIDCTSTDPASTVATLKVAVQNARQALKDYRTSLKNLVVAFKGASTGTSKDSTKSTDTNTTTNTNDTTTGSN